MPYNFTVSPDFGPDHLAGWYVFNTWVQRILGEAVHLEIYRDFASQRRAINAGDVDLIFANPYDASMLVRERGFVPLARPKGKIDEAIVAVSSDTNISAVEELESGVRVASTDDPDVHMMGLIMLEPADLSVKNITLQNCDSYVLVAKQLISGQCDVGIFLAQAFDDLSSVVRSRLKVLVRSDIQVVHHALMIGPAMAVYSNRLTEALLGMTDDEKARGVLQSLGFERWEPVDREAMEFMIDLVDTLLV